MNAAMLLKLSTDFEFFDGSGHKHHKGGEPPRVGLKVCVAKCGECEAKSDPWMMKRDAKADACMRLLPDVKAAYGDWNKVRTNRRNNPNPKSWSGPWQKQREMKKKQNRVNAAPYGNRPKHNSGGAGGAAGASAGNFSGPVAGAGAGPGAVAVPVELLALLQGIFPGLWLEPELDLVPWRCRWSCWRFCREFFRACGWSRSWTW